MKVSIITPTYNREALIKECIESVQASVLLPDHDLTIEHIIYDDASKDNTAEYIKSLEYKNLIYIKGEENKGPAYGRNIAIAKATGDFILPLDSDDILLQRSIFYLAKAAKESRKSWYITDFITTDMEKRYQIGKDHFGWKFNSPVELLKSIFDGQHFIQGNVMFSKKIFEEAGGYSMDLKMAEDLDLYIRFLINGHMPEFLPIVSHMHRFHAGNLSKDMDLERHMEDIKFFKEKYKGFI